MSAPLGNFLPRVCPGAGKAGKKNEFDNGDLPATYAGVVRKQISHFKLLHH